MINEESEITQNLNYDENPNKRSNLRIPLIVTKVKAGQGGKVFFGYAKNISRVGIFIQTINPKNEGERFKIEFQLPHNGGPISCMAEVIWKRNYHPYSEYEPGMGLKFIDLSEEMSDRLDRWVNLQ